MLLDHHHRGSERIIMGKTVTIDSDEEVDPLTSRLLGVSANSGSTRTTVAASSRKTSRRLTGVGGIDTISEYDSSESPSDRDDVLSSTGSDCDTASSQEGGGGDRQHSRHLHHHHHHLNNSRESTTTTSNNSSSDTQGPVLEIREVWNYNLYEEFMQICKLVKSYPFVAMDTEFPGIVAKPMGNFSTMDEYKYQLVKCNVDLLKMIQLGVTLFDSAGNRPAGVCTWQFNFKFSLSEDLYAEESIDLLMQSGIRFDRHAAEGVEPGEFAEMLLTSGLVLMDNVTWLTFHSAYDFGYLLSQLTCAQLPESETEFLDTLRVYFPNMYDIKYLMTTTEHLNGGLQKVANELRVKRIGCQHQAGSDSLLTGQVFFKMYEEYFKEGLDDLKYNGFICGLGGAVTSSSAVTTSSSSSGCIITTPSSNSVITSSTSLSASSTPNKKHFHHHGHHHGGHHHGHVTVVNNSGTSNPYLIEQEQTSCYTEMEEMARLSLAASPARVH